MEKYKDIINGDGLTLVDFYATWCGPCQMMHPILEGLKADKGSGIRILKIDIEKNEAVARLYGVRSVPTLMLFRKGEKLWRQSGALGLDDLKSIISRFE